MKIHFCNEFGVEIRLKDNTILLFDLPSNTWNTSRSKYYKCGPECQPECQGGLEEITLEQLSEIFKEEDFNDPSVLQDDLNGN